MSKAFIINDHITFQVLERKLIHHSRQQVIMLRAPAALCLSVLLERKGEIVSQKELFQYGWEDFGIATSNNTLHGAIHSLRKALFQLSLNGDEVIKTVPRRGFIIGDAIRVQAVTLPAGQKAGPLPQTPLASNKRLSMRSTLLMLAAAAVAVLSLCLAWRLLNPAAMSGSVPMPPCKQGAAR
ncbi:winged helix-turn-helix domain-containing protein [Pantoea sp. 1.19]|uniref:winged helix-turn-helix domain-containing protein n=1 Tax=Pantoea sp. 1.19 TaxID=1925589 RepID=UPI000948AA27|nr:winged helix-turn-helix domain-containing protein [Pantoea sp. 1.19]